MGYTNVTLTVLGILDAHNDERTQRDEEAWEAFRQAVQALADEPRFASLRLMVT